MWFLGFGKLFHFHTHPVSVQFPFGQLQLFKHALFSHAMPLKSASQIHRETGNSTRHQPLFEQPCGQSRMEQSSPINGGTHLARKTIIMNYFSKEFSHNIENIIQIKLVNNSVIFRKSNNVNMGKGRLSTHWHEPQPLQMPRDAPGCSASHGTLRSSRERSPRYRSASWWRYVAWQHGLQI